MAVNGQSGFIDESAIRFLVPGEPGEFVEWNLKKCTTALFQMEKITSKQDTHPANSFLLVVPF